MAIVKLVCQGCGANLDALDYQRVIQCTYCGAANQIKQTVHEQPKPAYPPPQSYSPTPNYQQPPTPIQYPGTDQVPANVRRGVTLVIVLTAVVPLIIGGVVAFMVFSQVNDAVKAVPSFAGTNTTTTTTTSTIGGTNPAVPRRIRWDSGKPFAVDVDGDGVEDVVGVFQIIGGQELVLAAASGVDGKSIWEVEMGQRPNIPGRPRVWVHRSGNLALLGVGTALTGYDLTHGNQRWVGNLSDAISEVSVDGEAIRVTTIDQQTTSLGVADGKPKADAPAEPGPNNKRLRDDEGYSLIPELRTLDLDSDQFEGLYVDLGYCPKADASVGNWGSDPVTCSFPHGLAWAHRAKGTQVPFMVGYDRATKAERWRVQLTTAGTLETVDTGFGQPRAELFGDEAVIGFKPPDDKVRIRRISLIDGATKWETVLESSATSPEVFGMMIGDARVFVNYGGTVYALDPNTGALLSQLNSW